MALIDHDVIISEHIYIYLCFCVQVREKMADTMRKVVELVTGNKLMADGVLNDRSKLSQHQCYKAAVSHYKHTCFNWNKPQVH